MRQPCGISLGIFAAVLFSAPGYGQMTSLAFEPVDAAYSLALDRIIMISGNPNQLHIYDAASNSDVTLALPDAPMNLSVSPDGLHAAVAHSSSISYVNLGTASIDHVFTAAVGTGKVVLSATYIYVLPSSSSGGLPLSIDISSGQATSGSTPFVSGGRLNPVNNFLYVFEGSLFRFDISTGPITTLSAPSHFGNYPICGDLWFSPDGTRIYTGCTTVLRSSSDPGQDMTYLSTLSNLNGVQALSESATLGQIAVVPNGSTHLLNPQSDGEVRLFESAYLNQVGRFVMPSFLVNGNSYQAHSRWVFFNRAGTSLFVMLQADSTSGLLNDFALTTVNLTNPTPCSATFSASSATSVGSGSLATVNITAGTGCAFQEVSNVPWIQLVSGSYGSGNNTLTYLVRPNTSSQPRIGTISMGSQTLTVTQDGAAAASSFNRLSFEVVAADFSRALDSIVFAVAGPNELHIYNPVSLADQIVPLPAAPSSVSVRPDGLYAAVGHQGWTSYVNLQSASVEQVFPADINVAGIVLASNGYVYDFSPYQNSSDCCYSLRLVDGALAQINDGFLTGQARLHSSGKYLYVAGSNILKLDIEQGPPVVLSSGVTTSDCGNLWLSEDGNRIFTACGPVYRSSEIAGQDLTPNGTLSGVRNSVAWAAHSIQQQETAVITSQTPISYPADDTQLQIYGDASLSLNSQSTLPTFAVNGNNYTGHGRFVFWNNAESKLFSVVQADSTAGLMSDYAVFISDQSSTLPQCAFSLSATSVSANPTGGAQDIAVTPSGACGWIAYPSDSWISINSGSSGIGAGTVNFTVASNVSNAGRSTSLTIAGQAVTINQQGASGCAYSLAPNSATLSWQGGTQSVAVSAGPGCNWTATSNAPWLTVQPPATGTGNGTFSFTAGVSGIGGGRATTITIGDQTLTVWQAAANESPSGLLFVPVTPCRVADTRNANGPFGGPLIAGQTTRQFSIQLGNCGIPGTAQAYALNVTVVPSGSLTFLQIWPSGGSQPTVSTLNSYDGRIKANAAIVPAGLGGGISVFATDDTHVVLDITGYFVPATANPGLAFYPLTPCRIADTRTQAGALGAPFLLAQQERTFPVLSSSCNVPSSAQAYSLNFTVVPQGPLTFLTTWPTGQSQPTVSTLNAPTGEVVANAAILPAGTNGEISIFATDNTDLVVDINGYFAPPGPGGLLLYTLGPCRVEDTRTVPGAQPLTGQLDVNVMSSACSLPPAPAYVFNATVVPETGLAYLSLWPTGQAQPVVSTLNANDAAVTSNLAIVPAANGSVSAYSSNSTHLILDIFGYFAP